MCVNTVDGCQIESLRARQYGVLPIHPYRTNRIMRRLRCAALRLKEGDEVETGDWQSNTVFAGYPLMIEAKEFMYSWFVQNKRKTERNLGVMEERVWENNTLKGKPLSHHGHNHTC